MALGMYLGPVLSPGRWALDTVRVCWEWNMALGALGGPPRGRWRPDPEFCSAGTVRGHVMEWSEFPEDKHGDIPQIVLTLASPVLFG